MVLKIQSSGRSCEKQTYALAHLHNSRLGLLQSMPISSRPDTTQITLLPEFLDCMYFWRRPYLVVNIERFRQFLGQSAREVSHRATLGATWPPATQPGLRARGSFRGRAARVWSRSSRAWPPPRPNSTRPGSAVGGGGVGLGGGGS